MMRSLILGILLICAHGRPVVRSIKSSREFDRLLEKHGRETGLPVVVDFYSDSCGPCRMMAPIFKKVAQEFVDKAVFVKVDTNAIHELSSRFNVRALPTFMWFVGGKSPVNSEKGGIGEGPLRQETQKAVRQAEMENVLLEYDDLVTYYQSVEPSKTEEDLKVLYKKCSDMIKGSDKCAGPAANQLVRRLKKKYKEVPKTHKRFAPSTSSSSSENKEEKTEGTKTTHNNNNDGPRSSSKSPNLHLATKEQLMEELEKRLDEERDNQEEEEEEEADSNYLRWSPGPFPQPVTIIGGGPAGMAAAIYAARAGLEPLVIAPAMGGQLQGKGVDVENYPALSNVTGPTVISSMRLQAAKFGTLFEDDWVISVDATQRPLKVTTNNTGVIETHAIIVATGAESKWLGVEGEWEMRGGGVSSCATCDGFLFSGKDVVVVGGGDTAMEDALVLARTSKSVTVVHRRDSFRASKVLANRVLDHPAIRVLWNTTVESIEGKADNTGAATSNREEAVEEDVDLDDTPSTPVQKSVTGVVLRDGNTGELTRIPVDAVFVAIGHSPSTSFLKEVVDFDPEHPGYLQTMPGSTQTSVEGIFAAGDVADSIYRQAITSAGSGAAAALDAERYLSEHGLGNEAAEMEAELLREMMAEEDDNKIEMEGYNAYADASGRVSGVKESFSREF